MTFFGLAGLVTATAGTVLKPARDAMEYYGFTIRDTDDGLRIRRGLTEKRTQTLPRDRVTAVTIVWPLLWRRAGWVRAHAANAGSGSPARGGEILASGTILPVGTLGQAREVTRHALSGVDITATEFSTVPARARWCAPVAQPVLGAALTADTFVTRSGRITRTVVAVPYARIQSIRVVQGRLARMLGLASVHVDFAGGLGVVAAARHRDATEALWMADQLRERSRAAQPNP